MEVGDQPVDRLETITRGDEDRGVAFERRDRAVVTCGAFDQAKRGRSDRDQAATRGAHFIQSLGGGEVDSSPLGVHAVVGGVIDLDRQKGACADMERERFALHSARVERGDQRVGEVQRGGRRGHRARFPREHRLVVVAVGGVGAALRRNIGRQRHLPGALEQHLDRLIAMKHEQDRPGLVALGGACHDPLAEVDRIADPHALGIAHERPPAARSLALVQGRADGGGAARAFKLGGNDAGVV